MTTTVTSATEPGYAQGSISGFCWYNGSAIDWRILYQAQNGKICALSGTNDSFTSVGVANAKLGTPLVSIGHSSSSGSGSQHFYLNTSNEVCVYNVGITGSDGPLKDSAGNTFKTCPESRLGAFAWVIGDAKTGNVHVRVAYQISTGEVQQINWDGNKNQTFSYAHKSPATTLGTSLAFLNQAPKHGDQYFRGYYQHQGTIMELVNEPSQYYIGSFTQSLPQKTQIIATHPVTGKQMFGRGQGPVEVYWVNADGTVSKRVLNQGTWGDKQDLPKDIRVSPGSYPLVLSWVPLNALAPIVRRLLWIGTDSKIHSYQY